MAKVSPFQGNFNGGEFSPLLYGRVDAERYQTGLATCLNYIPTIQGGLTRRGGTYYAAATKTAAEEARLVRFEFSTTQAYILEFGDQYIRFYRDHAQIDSGGSPYEIVTPYLEADLFQLRFTQSADVLYIVHPSYAPRKLTRTGHTAWTLSTISFLDGPYFSTNTTATTLTPSAATGTGVTLTASAVTGINGDTGFAATDVGRSIRLREGTTWGWVTITGWTSTTVVTVTVNSTLTNTNAKSTWRLGLWSGTTGYPDAVVFHEDRLVFAGATDSPQRIDGSNTGDYENFAPTDADGTVTDARAFGFTLNSNTVNAIQWMAPDERGLMVGTAGGEWMVRPSLQSEALSPTNVAAKQSTAYGAANVQAVSAGRAAIYVQRSGLKLRELRYFASEEGLDAPDLTLLAEHITVGGIKELARQAEPQSIVWAVRNDGTLVGATYERDADALRVGWHRHTLGGVGDASGGAPVVESAAVIPAPDGSKDELWLLVKRYINGATVRYVEYVTPIFTDDMDQEDAYFVDGGLSYDGAATDTFSGLDHLEGETLTVLADGAVHPPVTVASGAITLNYEASVVHVGYAYNSDGELLRLEAGAQDGTAMGKTRRIHRVGMLLHRSLGLSIGMSFDALDTITFRTSADTDDEAVPLFSGIHSAPVEARYDFDNQFCWRQNQPLPGTILAVMPQMVVQDRG